MNSKTLVAALLLACAASGAQAAICRAAPTAIGSADGATWADAMTLQAALARFDGTPDAESAAILKVLNTQKH